MAKDIMPVELTGSNPKDNAVTIASGGSLSGKIDLAGNTPVSIAMPSGWDAAAMTFAVSNDDVTYYPLYYDGAEYTLTEAGASLGLSLNPAAFLGWRYAKIRSGTASTAVNQTADRNIVLYTRPV